jgi:hypothetical protein
MQNITELVTLKQLSLGIRKANLLLMTAFWYIALCSPVEVDDVSEMPESCNFHTRHSENLNVVAHLLYEEI